jgi:transposase
MEHYAGLDVSIKDTSVCVIDDSGRLVCEVKVESEPEAIVAVLADEAFSIKRIGLEAGPLSQWLFGELAEAGLPMICVETRHMRAALSAQVNKSDRNDARGIAHMMRVGLYRPVHVKTLASQKRRILLTSRQLLQAKARDIENDLRGTLRNFGLKVGLSAPPSSRLEFGNLLRTIRTWPTSLNHCLLRAESYANSSAYFTASYSRSFTMTKSAVD